tara:strand:- start:526 stop:885 length:360 start_codon:yes stop_codon:yes gene_type:complete
MNFFPKLMEKFSNRCYTKHVKKKHSEPALEEFKFHYRNSDSIGLSDKYFMAHDLDEAIGMFDYICNKRHLDTQVTEIYKWNRWLSKWEKYDPEDYSSHKEDLDLHFKFEVPKNRVNFEH